jgi:DNA integrity scanning protein DisA with diadenylate cyclase activity
MKMCITDFLKERKQRRNTFIAKELDRYSEVTRKALLEDNAMSNKKKYNILLQMNRYSNKYTIMFGQERTAEFFKKLEYSDVLSLMQTKERYGSILKPSEINTLYESVKMQASNLQRDKDALKEKIEKVVGNIETVLPLSTQYHNIKTYYKYKDALDKKYEDLGHLEKSNKATKDLVKFEPVLDKQKNSSMDSVKKSIAGF